MCEWAEGKGMQTDEQHQHRTSRKHDKQEGSITQASPPPYRVTKSTQRDVTGEQKAVLWGSTSSATRPGTNVRATQLNLLFTEAETKAQTREVNWSPTNQLVTRDKPLISKNVNRSFLNTTVLFLWEFSESPPKPKDSFIIQGPKTNCCVSEGHV